MEPRLKGHRLHPGPTAHGEKGKPVYVKGVAVCQCGKFSPSLPSCVARMQWHREHLADVLAGKARLL